MEPMIFKTPERRHFLVEALEYCSFADVYRDLYKVYKDESCSTGNFVFNVVWAGIVSALLVWTISSGIVQILLWFLFGVTYATGRRNRDLEAQNAGAEFAIKVITAACDEMKAEAEKKAGEEVGNNETEEK